MIYSITENFLPRFSTIEIHNRKSNIYWNSNGSNQLYDILKHGILGP